MPTRLGEALANRSRSSGVCAGTVARLTPSTRLRVRNAETMSRRERIESVGSASMRAATSARVSGGGTVTISCRLRLKEVVCVTDGLMGSQVDIDVQT